MKTIVSARDFLLSGSIRLSSLWKLQRAAAASFVLTSANACMGALAIWPANKDCTRTAMGIWLNHCGTLQTLSCSENKETWTTWTGLFLFHPISSKFPNLHQILHWQPDSGFNCRTRLAQRDAPFSLAARRGVFARLPFAALVVGIKTARRAESGTSSVRRVAQWSSAPCWTALFGSVGNGGNDILRDGLV